MANIILKDRDDNETTYIGVSKIKVPAADGGEDVVFQLPPTLQKKTVSVTENGTTEITPDAGSDALSAVALTVDVPSSGASKFIVTVTPTNNSLTTCTANHTVDEVLMAYNAGMIVECHLIIGTYTGVLPLVWPSESVVGFGAVINVNMLAIGLNVNSISVFGSKVEDTDAWVMVASEFADAGAVADDISITIAEVRQVPKSSSADKDKFLRVDAYGDPEWQTVPNANGGSF